MKTVPLSLVRMKCLPVMCSCNRSYKILTAGPVDSENSEYVIYLTEYVIYLTEYVIYLTEYVIYLTEYVIYLTGYGIGKREIANVTSIKAVFRL